MKPVSYVVLENKTEEDLAPVMITSGRFDGFVFTFGTVKIDEMESEEGARLQYTYDIVQVPEDHDVQDDESDRIEFETTIGDILVSILEEEVMKQE